MAKIYAGQPIDFNLFSKAEAKIGDIKKSLLTVDQFLKENAGDWRLCNGQSCIDTLYHAMTGNSEVPDLFTEGMFLRQAKANRALCSAENDELKSHDHTSSAFSVRGNPDGSAGRTNDAYFIHSSRDPSFPYHLPIESSGGAETRPKNIAANFFIKVGY